MTKRRLLIFLASLDSGGGERVTTTLLRHIDRGRFDCTLVLARSQGAWLDRVPPDVPVVQLRAKRLRYALRPLLQLLRREHPELILSMGWGCNWVVALAHILHPHLGTKLIFSERNTFSVARRERQSRWIPFVAITRILYRRADRIIAVSQGVTQDLVETLRLPKDRFVTIYNPIVDNSILQMAEESVAHPWLEDDVPVLLSVGRLIPQKGYRMLLHAFAILRRRYTVRLVILGEGELHPELSRLAIQLGVDDDVQFMGFINNPYAWMRNCTVYVLSSRFEGLPGSLIEAMACGASVVSTDCPSGPKEIVHSGVNGILTPVGDPERLADAIEVLLDSPKLRRSLSEQAAKSSARFNVSSRVQQYEEVLTSVLSKHCGAATPGNP